MPKDRFSKFKPVNWNSDWKKTGSFGSQYNTLERKDAYDAYAENAKLKQQITIQKQQVQLPAKPKKGIRTQLQNQLLFDIANNFGAGYNNWEKNFLETINKFQFELSDKQKDILLQLKEKYNLAFNDDEWSTWKKIVY
jgi:hypothetical protein